jgi:DNA-binding NtrC family response regulator
MMNIYLPEELGKICWQLRKIATKVAELSKAHKEQQRAVKCETPIGSRFVTLRIMEKKLVVDALHQCNGNKTQAAKMLGIGVKTIYRKIDKYGLRS